MINKPSETHNSNVQKMPSRKLREGYVTITPLIRKELQQLRKETGIGAHKLVSNLPDHAKNLEAAKVLQWSDGRLKSAPKDALDYILKHWRAYLQEIQGPNKISKHHVTIITPQIRKRLTQLRHKSGISATKLLKTRDDAPKDLNPQIIQVWMTGKQKTARTQHLRFMIEAWEAHPPLIPFTKSHYKKIQQELERTGANAASLKRRMKDMPSGFSSAILRRFVEGTETQTWQYHIDYVLNTLRTLPTLRKAVQKPYMDRGKNAATPQEVPPKKPYISGFRKDLRAITQDEIDAITAQITRTSLSPHQFLKMSQNTPEGLHSETIRQWLSKRIKRTSEDRMKFVLDGYGRLPDKPLK